MASLPVPDPSQTSAPVTPTRPRPSVLVVDDDDIMRMLLLRVCANAGIAAEGFSSAEDFLARADLGASSVLVLDIGMPGMSGLDLHRFLRHGGHALPVLFLSGTSDIATAVEAMRDGAFDFIQKPFQAKAIVERIHAAFEAGTDTPPRRPAAGHAYRTNLSTLTARERRVHDLMLAGMTSKAIAAALGGSFRTVEIHRGRVLAKMGAAHLADLLRMAYREEPLSTAA